MSAQDNFNNACVAYETANVFIEKCCITANNNGHYFDVEILQEEFDILLQTILLEVACSDSVLSQTETRFIDKITDYIDILNSVDFKFSNGKTITWENIASLSPKSYNDFCKDINDWAEHKINHFLIAMSYGDINSSTDYLKEINDCILGIITQLCHVDGVFDEDTDYIAQLTINKYYKKWTYLLERFKNENQIKSIENNNSLKEQYLLKKKI